MSLDVTALITAEEYKDLSGIKDDNPNVDDSRIETFINAATLTIESYCNRKFVKPASAIDEIFNGDGTFNYFVGNRKLTTAPTLFYWSGTAWTSMVSPQYKFTYEGSTGEVYFTDGNIFSDGKKNYKINYLYGWTRATIPQDLKMICAQVVFRQWKRLIDNKEGLTSENFGDATVNFNYNLLSKDMKAALAEYRVVMVG